MVPPKMMAAGIGALGVLGLVGLLGWQLYSTQSDLTDANKDLGKSVSNLLQCRADNVHQTEQLTRVREELTATIRRIALDKDAAERALDEREQESRRLAEALAAERRAREEIYQQDPDCEEWGQHVVCAAMDSRIRERLSGLESGP